MSNCLLLSGSEIHKQWELCVYCGKQCMLELMSSIRFLLLIESPSCWSQYVCLYALFIHSSIATPAVYDIDKGW